MPKTEEILQERGNKYGSFDLHAKLTQGLKDIFYAHMQHYNKEAKLTDYEREGLDMIFHKLGRIGNGDPHYADSFEDIAGYAKLVANLQTQDQSFLQKNPIVYKKDLSGTRSNDD